MVRISNETITLAIAIVVVAGPSNCAICVGNHVIFNCGVIPFQN